MLEFDPTKERGEYPQTRDQFREICGDGLLRVLGTIDRLLHAAVITPRGHRIRVISLRRTNRREERAYAKERQSS